MKKLFLIAALALVTLTVSAQQRLYLSTYKGTDVTKFDGKTCNVTVSRLMFKGWNTLSLPFAMSEQELNQVFGNDCRLERLVGVEETAGNIQLDFQDCKADGLQANTPYIIYFTGENSNVNIAKSALIGNAASSLTFRTQGNEEVTMCGASKQTEGEGLYGVMAKDNADAKFVAVGSDTQGFYATRCYIKLASGTAKQLTTHHLAASETMGITAVATENEDVDVYNLNGVKVASKIQTATLKPGVYVVKGQKVLVK